MTQKRTHLPVSAIVAIAALALGGLSVQACSSSSGNPSPNNVVDVDSGADTATTDGGTGADTATGDDASTDSASDAWSPDSGTCFPGTPTTYIELLNACTSADHLDFTTALPKKKADGSLPPLP